MKFLSTQNIGTVDVSISQAPCDRYICSKKTFTHNVKESQREGVK